MAAKPFRLDIGAVDARPLDIAPRHGRAEFGRHIAAGIFQQRDKVVGRRACERILKIDDANARKTRNAGAP